jgi:hypothetical protein
MRFSLMSVLMASASSTVIEAAQAQATDNITTAITNSVSTATAVNGGNGDVVIGSAGTITLSSSATAAGAVIENSPNAVTNNGTITVDDKSNISGILVTDSNGGTVTNAGTISVTDSTPATTIATSGAATGSLTAGTARYGIFVEGSTPFAGSIIQSAGSISVLGNNSAAISIMPGLTGDISLAGSVSVTGNGSYALQTQGAITGGGVSITGTVSAFGLSSTAISIGAPVAGQLYINSAIQSNAYYNGAQITARPTTLQQPLAPRNEEQAGSAIVIGGNISGGVLLDTSSSVTTLGSAPALQIGATGTTELSLVSGYAAGLVNKGTITGNGIYDGIGANAIAVGGGTGAATIDGGIDNVGTIKAIAFAKTNAAATDATAISFGAGATTTTITNSGAISATANFGYNGNGKGDATAISDTVGALSAITNTGAITATSADGSAYALNLSGNVNGVTVIQAPSGTSSAPSIIGDINFGAGRGTLDLEAGTINGDILYGASTENALTLTNDSQLTSAITQASGGELALDVASGHLINTSLTPLTLSSLTIGKGGQIDIAIDPAAGQDGYLTVIGAVEITSGAKIGLDFVDAKLTAPATYTLVDATLPGALIGQPSVLLGEVPYFYVANLTTDVGAGVIDVSLRDRTFAEAGVPGNAAAYKAIFDAFDRDQGIFDTFNAASTQQAFKSVYQQLLPAYSGGLFEVLSEGAGALVEAQSNNQIVQRGDRSGAWAQQLGFGAAQNSSQAPGYYGGGLGFAFGWETPASPISTIGYSVAYMRGSISDEHAASGDQQVGTVYSAGVYWRETDGAFHANVGLNAGLAELNSVRNFSGAYFDGAGFTRNATSRWSGGMAQVHIGVDYEQDLGDDFFIKPSIAGDYFILYEGAHGDHNGGSGLDLNYASNLGKQGSATGALTFGTRIGEGFIWKPELTVGYKEVFGGPDDTVAEFAGGGSSFSLSAPAQKGGPMAKIGIHGGDKYTDIAFEAGGEDRGDYKALSGQLVARFNF